MQLTPLSDPIDAVVFDCDGTLSLIEGINVLAAANGVESLVMALTEQAMSHVGMSPGLYKKRIELTRPTRVQVIELAQQYYASRAPAVAAVINCLQQLGKSIYVVSSGVDPAVTLFATMLDIPADHVRAVKVCFSGAGDYLHYDDASVLTQHAGKQKIAREIKQVHPRLIWVGDGMNDAVVKDDVVRFIGYGGMRYRASVAACADYYLKQPSMSPILALSLTAREAALLSEQELVLYQDGLELVT